MSRQKRFKGETSDLNLNYESDDVSNSEDEYDDTERKLLEKVRKKRTRENFDSDDEVYGLQDENDNDDDDDEEDEKDSMASDIEGLEQDDDLPDERAWGKNKRSYYSTDYVDQDYASASHKDMAQAEMEEAEARNIQKRLAEQLDDADFGLDLFETEAKEVESDAEDEQIIKTDLSTLSKRQKQALMKKESPEFEALLGDFKERMTEAKSILAPFLKLVEIGKCPNGPAVNFVQTKYQLILNYCVNISFYLMLKAKKISVASHPVIKRLAQYRQLLTQLEEFQGQLITHISEVLEADQAGQPLYSTVDNVEINRVPIIAAKKTKPTIDPEISIEPDSIEEDHESVHDEETAHIPEEDNAVEEYEGAEDEKRAITYQISKNKGLTPHRKKEDRNPRVKHRNKYRKAIIRRKGAVREVRTENRRYDGEMSGIKASVKKSIKIK